MMGTGVLSPREMGNKTLTRQNRINKVRKYSSCCKYKNSRYNKYKSAIPVPGVHKEKKTKKCSQEQKRIIVRQKKTHFSKYKYSSFCKYKII